eukprot:scaffold265131_cov32-Tisochrysis_lutea.AAC.3
MKERLPPRGAWICTTKACSSQQSLAPQSTRVHRVAVSAACSRICPSPGAPSSSTSPTQLESESQHKTAAPVCRSLGLAPSPGSSSSAACTSASDTFANMPPCGPVTESSPSSSTNLNRVTRGEAVGHGCEKVLCARYAGIWKLLPRTQ